MSRLVALILGVVSVAVVVQRASAEPWPFDPTGSTHRVWHNYGEWVEQGAMILHAGIDIAAAPNTVTKAIADGRVVRAYTDPGPTHYNSFITVRDDANNSHGWLYGHSEPTVARNADVSTGDPIGNIRQWPGTTSHLHLERVSDANGGWPSSDGDPALEHILDDPLLFLNPAADGTAPTVLEFKYRRGEDEGNDANPKYMDELDCGLIVVGSRAPNGSANIDIIVDAYDQFAGYADRIGLQKIAFTVNGRLGDGIGNAVTPYHFQGEFVSNPDNPADKDNKTLMLRADYAQTVYENDSEADSADNAHFWHIVTNMDDDPAATTKVEYTDAKWWWDSDGDKDTEPEWNDNKDDDERASNNAHSTFRDDFYNVLANASDEAGNTTPKNEDVLLDNWHQTVEADRELYWIGEPVYVETGEQHQQDDSDLPVHELTKLKNCEAITGKHKSNIAETDTDGIIQKKFVWPAGPPGAYYMVSDYDHDDDYYKRLDGVDSYLVLGPCPIPGPSPVPVPFPPTPVPTPGPSVTPVHPGRTVPVPSTQSGLTLSRTSRQPGGILNDVGGQILTSIHDDGLGGDDIVTVFDTTWLDNLDVPLFPDQVTYTYLFENTSLLTGLPGTLLDQSDGLFYDIEFNPVESFFDVYFDVEYEPHEAYRYWLHGEVTEPGLFSMSDLELIGAGPDSIFDLGVTIDRLIDPLAILPDTNVLSMELRISAHFIPGDANYDWVVGVGDLGMLAANWGDAHAAADFNADLICGVGDLGILGANWGATLNTSLTGADAVPTPTAGIAGLALCALAASRRRRPV